jgi:hypothetical protein
MAEVENSVIEAVQQQRIKLKIAPYKVVPMLQLRKMACEMAKKDSLKGTPINPYAGEAYIGSPSQDIRSFTSMPVQTQQACPITLKALRAIPN